MFLLGFFFPLDRASPSRTRPFFHNEKVAEGRVSIAIHFAFVCLFPFFVFFFFRLCLTFTACLRNKPEAKKKVVVLRKKKII